MMPDDPASTSDDRVVSIRTGRRFHPTSGRPDPSQPTDDLEKFAQAEEPDDFAHRMRTNAIAFAFVAMLVMAGLWLASSLAIMRKNQDCVLSGKRGCTPVETTSGAR